MSQLDNSLVGFEDKKLSDIEHWGIKGMSWGVQNGPPYPLDKETSQAIKKGNNPKTMSDQELRDKINRLNMEKQYNELSHPYMTLGKEFLEENTKKIAGTVVTAVALASTAVFLHKYFPDINFNLQGNMPKN